MLPMPEQQLLLLLLLLGLWQDCGGNGLTAAAVVSHTEPSERMRRVERKVGTRNNNYIGLRALHRATNRTGRKHGGCASV